MKITEKQICEDQIVTFKQSHILLHHGLLFLTRSTCVIVDARSHTCKSHDFIHRYDIILITQWPFISTHGRGISLADLPFLSKFGPVVWHKYIGTKYMQTVRRINEVYDIWAFVEALKLRRNSYDFPELKASDTNVRYTNGILDQLWNHGMCQEACVGAAICH